VTIVATLLAASLAIWYWSEGTVSVQSIIRPKVEWFYWVTILFSQTLGTALGDWMADTNGLGYEGGALVFGAGLALVAAAYFFMNTSRVLLFWLAFILTRPLGATLGDLLDKPLADGGLAISRFCARMDSRLALAIVFGFGPPKIRSAMPVVTPSDSLPASWYGTSAPADPAARSTRSGATTAVSSWRTASSSGTPRPSS